MKKVPNFSKDKEGDIFEAKDRYNCWKQEQKDKVNWDDE